MDEGLKYYRTNIKPCTDCKHTKKMFCGEYCRKQPRNLQKECSDMCEPLSEKACISFCSGDRVGTYKVIFDKEISKFLNERTQSCGYYHHACNCNSQRVCYYKDQNCTNSWNNFCIHHYRLKFCPKYKAQLDKAKRAGASVKGYFFEKLGLEQKRNVKKQEERLKFDEEKIQHLQELVFRYNRDTVYDAILLMEGVIYQEMRKMSANLVNDEKSQETEIMDKIKAGHISRETFKKLDKELKVFDK